MNNVANNYYMGCVIYGECPHIGKSHKTMTNPYPTNDCGIIQANLLTNESH